MAVWLVGVVFEAVGDHQIESFRRDPAHKGKVIDSGLWRYTRHPNYFGEPCVWRGIFLVAAERWPGVLTVFAPVVMTLLLTRGSGARILDDSRARVRGGVNTLPGRAASSRYLGSCGSGSVIDGRMRAHLVGLGRRRLLRV